jgi:Zn-dependent protease
MELIVIAIYIIAFLYSVIFHEIAHGWVASRFGDDTAKVSGRLSLNPLVHIDFLGSIIVPLILIISQSGLLFGWAKPVPVNPYKLAKRPLSYRLVTVSGILTNIFLAVFSAIILKITTQYFGFTANNLGVIFFSIFFQINLVLAVFNSLPLPGFDGFNFLLTFSPVAHILKQTPLGDPLFMVRYGLLISITLLFFLMPYISNIFSFIFGLFINFFGL